MKKWKSLQNSALRIINFKPFKYNATNLYLSSNITPISKVVILNNLIFVFEFFQQTIPKSFKNFFSLTANRHEHNTRNKNMKLVYPFYNTTKFGKNSIKYQCVSVWNNNINNIRDYFIQKYGINNRYNNFQNLNKNQFFKLINSLF